MNVKLTSEQRDALKKQEGPVFVEDDENHRVYVLIDQETLESLREEADMAAIRRGIADADAGRVQSVDEAFRQIEEKLRARFSS